jgi:hypothetical protein
LIHHLAVTTSVLWYIFSCFYRGVLIHHVTVRVTPGAGGAALACLMADAGSSTPSNAATINSAGKSMWTPSEYVYASRGEYAGGSRRLILALSFICLYTSYFLRLRQKRPIQNRDLLFLSFLS